MKTKNTLALTFSQAKGRYGDLLGGMLVLIAIRLIALCPLMTLLYKGDSLLKYGWILTPVLYLFWVILEKLCWGIDIPGYATIIVLILLLGSIQLFSIGIIGEYVGRTFEQSKNRPVYIAKEYLTYEKE